MSEHAKPGPGDVTLLLESASAGDHGAQDRLLDVLYSSLRRIAAGEMQRESPANTLQPTALVHEAYLRLLGGGEPRWTNRAHFFGAAALAMRRILVDRARERGRLKRGGGRRRVELGDEATEDEGTSTDLLALEPALERLREHDHRQYDVVMLRYFAGLSVEQVAQCLNISEPTVKRDWTVARARLRRDIETQQDDDE